MSVDKTIYFCYVLCLRAGCSQWTVHCSLVSPSLRSGPRCSLTSGRHQRRQPGLLLDPRDSGDKVWSDASFPIAMSFIELD